MMGGANVSGFFRLSGSERTLLLGQSISVIGDFMAFPAMLNVAASVGGAFGSSFLAVYFLPRCLQPFLGFIVDQYDARRVAILSDLARMAIFVLLFYVPAAPDGGISNVAWLAACFASSFLAALFEPARLKVMSTVASDFSRYNSLSNFVCSIGGLVSLAGGVLVEVCFDTRVVFLVNAATFAASAVLLLPVKYSQERHLHEDDTWRASHLWNGFTILLGHRGVVLCTSFVVLIDCFTGIIFDSFTAKSLGAGMGLFGAYIFYAAVCVGNSVGTLLVGDGLHGEAKWLWCCGGAVICVSVFLSTDSAAVSVAACLGFFIVQIIAIVSSEIEIQRSIPAGYQGRLFAINESLPFLALSAGGAIHAALSAWLIIGFAVASFTCLLIAASLAPAPFSQSRLWRIRN
jgi:hypothetical protein